LIVGYDGLTELISDVLPQVQGQGDLRLLRHDTDRGAAPASNPGGRVAAGRCLAFVDSDDTGDREKLAPLLAFMEGHASYRASCAGFTLSNDGRVFDRRMSPAVSDSDEILWGLSDLSEHRAIGGTKPLRDDGSDG
jgi:hypothetical protein